MPHNDQNMLLIGTAGTIIKECLAQSNHMVYEGHDYKLKIGILNRYVAMTAAALTCFFYYRLDLKCVLDLLFACYLNKCFFRIYSKLKKAWIESIQ